MIFERVQELARKRKLSLQDVEDQLGYSRNILYKLKHQSPRSIRVIELADFFNVSADYLLGRDEFISKQNNTFIAKDIQGGRDVTINNNSPQEKTINNLDNSVDFKRDSITLSDTDEVQSKMLVLLEKQTKLLEDMLFEIKKS